MHNHLVILKALSTISEKSNKILIIIYMKAFFMENLVRATIFILTVVFGRKYWMKNLKIINIF